MRPRPYPSHKAQPSSPIDNPNFSTTRMRPHELVLPQGQDTTLLHKYKLHPNPNLLGLQEAL